MPTTTQATPARGGGHRFAVAALHDADGERVGELQRTLRGPDARAPIGVADLRALALLALACPAAAIGGRGGAQAAVRLLARLDRGDRARARARFRRSLAAVGDWPEAECDRRFDRHEAQKAREGAVLALELVRRARFGVSVDGLDALRAALAQGRGAILWIADTLSASILVKRALHEAGLPLRHVSARAHGLSPSRFGRAALNPFAVAAEDRYLAERLPFDVGAEADLLRRARRVLADGGLLGMTMNSYAGARFYETGFGRAGHVLLSATIPRLALASGAALFTAVLEETEPLSRYRLRIGADCAQGAGAGAGAARRRDPLAPVRVALRARDRLLAAFLECPEAFRQPGRTDMGRALGSPVGSGRP